MTSNLVIFIPTEKELKAILGITKGATYRGIDIIVSGIGKTNTAINTTKYFMNSTKENALMIGICGSYHGKANVGDVVTIKHDYFVDEASLDDMNTLTTIHEKGHNIANNNCATFNTIDGFTICDSNTVSFIPCIDSISNLYQKKTNAHVENMEGAAFGVATSGFNINAYQLRAVSNYCGDRDNQAWDIKKACKNLKQAIDNIIDRGYL